MDIITIDFETYYDKEFSLSKMTTEQYIRDPRFELIGVGVKINHYPTDWYSGENFGGFLKGLDWKSSASLSHNTMFDGAIMGWRLGIKPKLWLDTLSMARPLHAMEVSLSLKALCNYYGLGAKGDEVVNALGKRKAAFSGPELARYGDYCINDVELTYKLFKKLVKRISPEELKVIDATLRMYIEPKIELDATLLQAHLDDVIEKKNQLLYKLDSAGIGKAELMSNQQLANLLIKLGVEPPTKVSKTTGCDTYAFSKSDKEFLELQNHPSPLVQAIVSARLGVKSTLEETRTQALLGVAERGRLPIALNYYGAHTGRFSGGEKLNLQNLPRKGMLRKAMRAPKGHVVVTCDSSQIEARTLAWLAGQNDLVDAFKAKRDVYSEFASELYDRRITKEDKEERFVGKVCIAEGTMVLTHTGWKPIETISTSDLLWDGEDWVCHSGLANNGIKKTLSLCGAWLTPDHLVWSGTQWVQAKYVVENENILSQTLDTAAVNLPSQGLYLGTQHIYSSNVIVTKLNTESTFTTSKNFGLQDVLCALKKQAQQSVTGLTRRLCTTTSIERDYLIGCRPQLVDVTNPRINTINTTGYAASPSVKYGEKTKPSFYGTFKHWMGGIFQLSKWTEQTSTKDMNPAISGSSPNRQTYKTNAELQISKRVYDILNCGSKNRFTILTDAGPVIVHNCVLGLGYGLGAERLQETLASGSMGMKVNVSLHTAQRMVSIYRTKNYKITGLWDKSKTMLSNMVMGRGGMLCPVLTYDENALNLPNGMQLRYPMLQHKNNSFRYMADPKAYLKLTAKRMAGEPLDDDDLPWTYIYGGKVVENFTQAVARIIITGQLLELEKRYPVVLQVHDELVFLAPEEEKDQAVAFVTSIMSTPPKWAPDLPVACEAGVGPTYGDAK